MATPPPTPPSPPAPPEGAGSPDAGNLGHATPPEVAPKPARTTAKSAKPPVPKRSAKASSPSGKSAASKSAAKRPAPLRRASRPGPTIARAPGVPKPVSKVASTPAPAKGGSWKRVLAGGAGVIAAGAALLTLRGSTRRKKAHQADGTDSSKSFAAGIADEGTIPE